MTFAEWKSQVVTGLARRYDTSREDAASLVDQTGDHCWMEMYRRGMSPVQAVSEEAYVAASMF